MFDNIKKNSLTKAPNAKTYFVLMDDSMVVEAEGPIYEVASEARPWSAWSRPPRFEDEFPSEAKFWQDCYRRPRRPGFGYGLWLGHWKTDGSGPDVKATVQRNDKCPCGSDKKFKNCCLQLKPQRPFSYRRPKKRSGGRIAMQLFALAATFNHPNR